MESIMDQTGKKLRILLRGSWQTKNIGDIAHTPGFLSLAEKVLPDAEIWLCPSCIDNGVREMLLENFPGLKIADDREKLLEAYRMCDIYVNGSGPFAGIDCSTMNEWFQHTGKPYGCFGVSTDGYWSAENMKLISGASFIFCRDTLSENYMKLQKLECNNIKFAPDATFYIDVKHNTEKSDAFLQDNGLEKDKFICVIPRLRWTPSSFDDDAFYYTDKRKENVSMQHVEKDMEKLRDVICHIVRNTPFKVLICPEMTYQVPMGRRFIYDRLPDDVKAGCVLKREYWITDEAIGVYRNAHSLISMEMHSPILFVTCGKPAILLRQAEDTWKGQMWRDIGLQKWILELNSTESAEIIDTVTDIIENYPAALEKARQAAQFACGCGAAAMKDIAAAAEKKNC